MRLLCHRIGPRKDRTRFALAKVQLPEEALTLPYAQLNLPVLFKPPRQRLAVPQVNRHTVFAGTLPKNPIQLLQFPFTQTGGSAPPWAFASVPFHSNGRVGPALGFRPDRSARPD